MGTCCYLPARRTEASFSSNALTQTGKYESQAAVSGEDVAEATHVRKRRRLSRVPRLLPGQMTGQPNGDESQ